MAKRRFKPNELEMLLKTVPPWLHDELYKALDKGSLLAEGQAKINCGFSYGPLDGRAPANIPDSPYQGCPYKNPPHDTGKLCGGNHGWVEDKGTELMGWVANSVSEYNVHVHEGTSRTPGRPYLADAVRQQKTNINKLLAKGTKDALSAALGVNF